MEKVDFVVGEIARVGTEDFKNFVASREKDFEIELRLWIADGDEDVAGLCADGFRRELAFQVEVELIHFDVGDACLTGTALGNRKDDKQENGKCAAGHSGDGLGEQVNESNEEKDKCDEAEADGKLRAEDSEIERDLEFALARLGITKNENGEAVHRETPDDTKRIEVCKERDITAAQENGDDLQRDNDVDDAIAGAETRMWLAEPGAEHAIFRDTVENTIPAQDGGGNGAGENESSNDDDKSMKDEAGNVRALKVHGQAANQIL